MKIICEVHELIALQRTSELDAAHARLVHLESEVSRAWLSVDAANEKAYEAERKLANAIRPEPSTKAIMSLLAKAFHEKEHGNKIAAIKFIREALGCGLREAKDIVEGSWDSTSFQDGHSAGAEGPVIR